MKLPFKKTLHIVYWFRMKTLKSYIQYVIKTVFCQHIMWKKIISLYTNSIFSLETWYLKILGRKGASNDISVEIYIYIHIYSTIYIGNHHRNVILEFIQFIIKMNTCTSMCCKDLRLLHVSVIQSAFLLTHHHFWGEWKWGNIKKTYVILKCILHTMF